MTIPSVDKEFLKNSIQKSKNKLQSIYEAIINSLEASNNKNIKIKILFHFSGLIKEDRRFEQIDIVDNGVGFTDENYNRFSIWGDKSKKKSNRGTGRMQFYYDFEKIEVNSLYMHNEKLKSRKFICDSDSFDIQIIENKDVAQNCALETTVSLQKFRGKVDELTIDKFVNELYNNLLLRFYLEKKEGKQIEIKIAFKHHDSEEERTISNEAMPKPDKIGKFFVNYHKIVFSNKKIDFQPSDKRETIKWARFKIEGAKGNEAKLCSKNIPVCSASISNIINEACKSDDNKYFIVFYGDILDRPDNVNHSADNFTFPEKKDFRKSNYYNDSLFDEEYMFFDELNEKINSNLSNIYPEITSKLNSQRQRATELARQHGIDIKYAKEIKTDLQDNDDKIVKKLFRAQSEKTADNAIKIKNIEEKLNQINPVDKHYEEQLNTLMKDRLILTQEQDREELSKYIIRRDFVTKLLKKILNDALDCQQKTNSETERKNREGIIHDLFFKRKTQNLNDLWLLNEEFVHFEGASDKNLNQLEINGEKLLRNDADIEITLKSLEIENNNILKWRPDIFIYPEEAKCVLVEFKAPDVELSKHCDQIQKYAKIIANYSRKPFKQFYGFLIGEQINQLAVPDRYHKAIKGNYWWYPDESINDIKTGDRIASIYQEIIPLSEIAKRAEIRNRSFAQKLGLY